MATFTEQTDALAYRNYYNAACIAHQKTVEAIIKNKGASFQFMFLINIQKELRAHKLQPSKLPLATRE